MRRSTTSGRSRTSSTYAGGRFLVELNHEDGLLPQWLPAVVVERGDTPELDDRACIVDHQPFSLHRRWSILDDMQSSNPKPNPEQVDEVCGAVASETCATLVTIAADGEREVPR